MAKIRIQRTNDFGNFARDYKIFIDGQMVGSIANKEIKEFTTSSGQHTVTARVDWCSTNITVDTNDKRKKTLLVGSSHDWCWIVLLCLGLIPSYLTAGYLKIIFMLLPIFLFPVYFLKIGCKRYLTLEEI